MQKDKLNTAVIESFIKQVKQADASRSKEVRLDMQAAKDITFQLAIILARIHGRLEDHITTAQNTSATEIVQIKLDGGADWK